MNINIEQNKGKEHLILFVHGLQGSKETFYEEKDKNYFHEHFESIILDHVDIGYLEYHTEDILSKKSILFILNSFVRFFRFTKKEPVENLNIEELSISATNKIEKIISDYKSVNFICHSMGGLVAKGILLKNEVILEKTNFYITLATPHRGTNKAKYLNGINRQVKSLEEDSQIIRYLSDNYSMIQNKLNRHYYRATSDSWVLPKENAFPIFEEMHTSPVDCTHTEISKPRHDVYLGPLIYDINKKIRNYLSLNKVSKELYNIEEQTNKFSKSLYSIETQIIKFSKSLYARGIQCPKSLWLKKYNKEVLSPIDDLTLSSFEIGNEVGNLACNLFSGGKKVPFHKDLKAMLYTTKKYLEDGMQYVYEATFNYNGIVVMVDILSFDPDGVSIYEVKSSTSIKDIYIHDASIQYYVLKNLGFNIKNVNIIHVDSSYIRGKELDIHKLFSIYDIIDEVVLLQDSIPNNLKKFEDYLSDKINEPNIDIGKHCHDPYVCDAKDYCWKTQRQIPEYSIFNIFNLGSKKQIELYSQGIKNIENIPDDFDMTANQKAAVENYKLKETFIDKEKIKEFVDTLTYPIYHLDFETFQQAIPEFEGISPYQQIPFQYSLHIEHEDGTLEHKEYLALDGIDPREQIASRLVDDIPIDMTVLAYNMSFEKGVIKRLADSFANLRTHLLSINENMKDLMIPFQKKYYVTPSMNGSYSIKYVLPALVPELALAYKELDGVQNGSQAMNAFANMSKMEEGEKSRMRTALIEYCKLDTLAMVKILERLRGIN